MNALVSRNLAVIDQGLEMLDDLRQARNVDCIPKVGPHLRHCIDFYDCFLSGLDLGRIDYDARERSKEVETAPESATAALSKIRERLLRRADMNGDGVLEVRADAVPEQRVTTRSTIARELLFLLSHTIHHYALIALALSQEGIEVAPGFGFAPSTLEHAKRQAECAP